MQMEATPASLMVDLNLVSCDDHAVAVHRRGRVAHGVASRARDVEESGGATAEKRGVFRPAVDAFALIFSSFYVFCIFVPPRDTVALLVHCQRSSQMPKTVTIARS